MILIGECSNTYAKDNVSWLNDDAKMVYKRVIGGITLATVKYMPEFKVFEVLRPGATIPVNFNTLHDALWHVEESIL